VIVLNVYTQTEDKIDNMKNSIYEELECVYNREDIYKQTIWNESLPEVSNDNGIEVINFSISKLCLSKI
jgi:hypothetical protein